MSKKKTAMPKITLIVLLSISAVLLILLGIWLVGELKDSFSDPADGTEPVSYTHLDVYKRQAPNCSHWYRYCILSEHG